MNAKNTLVAVVVYLVVASEKNAISGVVAYVYCCYCYPTVVLVNRLRIQTVQKSQRTTERKTCVEREAMKSYFLEESQRQRTISAAVTTIMIEAYRDGFGSLPETKRV